MCSTFMRVPELIGALKSANYVRTELPVRIAHRLRDMQTLPYVVVNHEGVASVYEAYWYAFDKYVHIAHSTRSVGDDVVQVP